MARKTRQGASDPLVWIQTLVRCEDYLLSDHVTTKLEIGEVSRDDIEHSILHGSISQVCKDEKKASKDGKKYVITGPCSNGLPFETVGKLTDWVNGETYFIITAYGKT